MSDIDLEFDRAVAGGYETGDRVTVADTPYIRGLIGAGLAHQLEPGDVDPTDPETVPHPVEPYEDVTAEHLTAELALRGLPKSGTKPELTERLRADDATRSPEPHVDTDAT